MLSNEFSSLQSFALLGGCEYLFDRLALETSWLVLLLCLAVAASSLLSFSNYPEFSESGFNPWCVWTHNPPWMWNCRKQHGNRHRGLGAIRIESGMNPDCKCERSYTAFTVLYIRIAHLLLYSVCWHTRHVDKTRTFHRVSLQKDRSGA